MTRSDFLIGDLFSIKYGNGKLTNKFMRSNPGPYPVFGASADPRKAAGWIDTYDFDQDCLSFVRIGYAGHVALRAAPFSVTCNVLVLVPKPEVSDRIHLPFFVPVVSSALRRIAQGRFKEDGRHDYTQVTQQGALAATVSVPVDSDGLPDYDAQVTIARRYEKLAGTKDTLKALAERLERIELMLPLDEVEIAEFKLDEVFELHRGKSEYTKAFARANPGEFPLYTAATRDVKPDKISKWDFDTEALHYTTEGAHAGTVFHRSKHKFAMSGHAGILVRKSKLVDYRYAFHVASSIFREQGFRWSSNTASNSKVTRLLLPFPVNSKGELDVIAQQRIASRLDQMHGTKADLMERINRLIQSEVVIDA